MGVTSFEGIQGGIFLRDFVDGMAMPQLVPNSSERPTAKCAWGRGTAPPSAKVQDIVGNLRLYDRTGGATGDVNDPAHEAYRMHMAETLTDLGSDPAAFGTDAVGTYRDLLRDVFARLGWDPTAFTGSRVAIEHPLLGTQVAQVYHPPQR